MRYEDISHVHKVALGILTGTMLCSVAISEPEIADILRTFGIVTYSTSINATRFIESETKEHKLLEIKYNKIINSFNRLCDELKLRDPIDIFILFVYMYRKGYLSVGHSFEYDTDMKDFASLFGIDVIRGHGVCRSIASMLNDIYIERNLDSGTLTVCAKNLKEAEKFSKAKIQITQNGAKVAKIIGKITKTIGISNHLIIDLYYKGYNLKLDPTNDLILINGKFGKIKTYTSAKTAMKKGAITNCKLTIQRIIKSPSRLSDWLLDREIVYSYDEYKDRYIKVNDIIDNSQAILEEFYVYNKDNYKYIDEISSKQKSMLKRNFI